MRVPLPRNVRDLISLSADIFKKHSELAADSPLKTMENYNWDEQGPNIIKAKQLHDEAVDFQKKMENAYRERDLLIGGLDNAVKASRDILLGTYRQNMKRMGDWGFVVDDTPKQKTADKKEDK